MVYSSNIGIFDFNRPKVRLNGRVLDKFSLASHMRDLNPGWYWKLLYYEVFSYCELVCMLKDYLLGGSED